ncbi:hydroxymethylglutaryl-CoA synthase 1 [Adelges cooleyi]|uniref:hydroxymethylglutaryl-CoA synthase 1 n=1 Tax=Adelges cooleyi TaxID=133065 RepID=UPI0021800249|nr:hydroxymethylglutaryl-CoA synthase 1 [Adelges cooleyi]XP_050429912.1 hydroxymethylglutaryl-CoA synthase 1 [Adelges cooleyi]XP_050429913.1 hydroxymethylglutaryl-CoA synthase 1 [Adelges cooleyi]XP_050429914.1 hydroxymethylglutaryl-CoA synthase 1 [Adelges cooleyi]
MDRWPKDVGIRAIHFVVPSLYVDQTDLERYDQAAEGKYTIGLGQKQMGFCTDLEDINSLCLTAVSQLVENNGIDYTDIGRLEVGTETIIDKSKSVKSVLMKLFQPSGNFQVEGIDTTNACYGGTAALFNALSWIESSAWDGRLAIVVAADIAVYAKGNARPTGGAGAVAMLVGPDAPLVIERGLRGSYMNHAYDFFKPDLTSEYPVVDGKLSIQCYLNALDQCYKSYRSKCGKKCNLNEFDSFVFHTPYCKLVQKSLARLYLNDFVNSDSKSEDYPGLERFQDISLPDTYFDRDVEKAFMERSKDTFERMTKPSLLLASRVGNMYTPSVYGGLASYLVSLSVDQLPDKKIGVFSYGSGLASSMYSIRVSGNDGLPALISNLKKSFDNLERRLRVSPENFTEVLEIRQKALHQAPYVPIGNKSDLFPGTWYLSSVDEMHRRYYERKES